MEIIIIVAYGTNLVIGKNGGLPDWKLRDDMAYFKSLTIGEGHNAVLMGRKTFESFPEKFRPLPNRANLIVTKTRFYQPTPSSNQTFVFDSPSAAAFFAANQGYEKLFVIGGGQIYERTLKSEPKDPLFPTSVIATEVNGEFEGDVFFPKINLPQKEILQTFSKDERNSHDFNIVKYTLAP